MKALYDWNGQPYYPISQFYKKKFGQRVHKISVSVAESCPNRRGKDGTGCIFCDQWGGAGAHMEAHLPLKAQIEQSREELLKRFKTRKFLVYFQAFTNTYVRLNKLEKELEEALSEDMVCGVVLGTRPDCLPRDALTLLRDVSQGYYVSVELGVQSFSDRQLDFLERGHSARQSIEAINLLYESTEVDIGVHLIFGLPNETIAEVKSTADQVNRLPINSVKLHNLHVLAGAPLERLYRENRFRPISLETYSKKVIAFLELLSPKIAVQRLSAYAGRRDELIAPSWTGNRMAPSQFIINQMKQKHTCQGKLCSSKNETI